MTPYVGGGKESSVFQGYYNAEYMGGHAEYPSRVLTTVEIYTDKIVMEALGLEIPYLSMTNIENIDEQRMSAGRVVGLGLVFPVLAVVGAMWKKKHRYTVIQYGDGDDRRAIVIDFGENIDSAQPLIYRRMIRLKQSPKPIQQVKGFLLYENIKYGIRMEYPSHWIEDEIDQKNEDYISVVQFREVLGHKPPFVTIYINMLVNPNISLKEYLISR
jgi:hypothetical protein